MKGVVVGLGYTVPERREDLKYVALTIRQQKKTPSAIVAELGAVMKKKTIQSGDRWRDHRILVRYMEPACNLLVHDRAEQVRNT